MNPLLVAALEYARRNWPVFLVRPNSKEPLGGRGYLDATTDPEKIEQRWSDHPTANIGGETGQRAGHFILDSDRHNNDGQATLGRLQAEHDELPDTLTDHTPNNGLHFFFQQRDDSIRNRTSFQPGLDIRGDGGYVLLPPSVVNGKPYHFEDPDTEIAAAPDWLLELISTKKRRIREGERNDTLFREVCSLRARGVDDDDALHSLRGLNENLCAPPLGDTELEKLWESSLRYPKGFPCTDLGNAERLVALHGRDLRYVPEFKRWLHWTGSYWADDRAGVMRRAKLMARHIYTEAADVEDDKARAAIAKWAKQSEASMRLKAAVELAETEPDIPIEPDDLDADPWLLGVENGVVDLRAGKFQEAQREHLITNIAEVKVDPSATCPRFIQFIDEIFDGDESLAKYIQCAIGYSLTGKTGEQCIFFLYGTGANGKTTLLKVLTALVGGYGKHVLPESLMMRRGDSIPNDIARLRGTRFIATSETEEGKRLAENLVKRLTGEDRITARFLFGEYFEFDPQFKIWLAANHKPVIHGDDYAIWRRIKLIPFTKRFERDDTLLEQLLSELPGVLNWAVVGCQNWQHHGLQEPESVKGGTDDYRAEMDIIHGWIEAHCTESATAKGAAGVLWNSYKKWAEDMNEWRMPQRRFAQKLQDKGFRRTRTKEGIHYIGIGIRTDEDGTVY